MLFTFQRARFSDRFRQPSASQPPITTSPSKRVHKKNQTNHTRNANALKKCEQPFKNHNLWHNIHKHLRDCSKTTLCFLDLLQSTPSPQCEVRVTLQSISPLNVTWRYVKQLYPIFVWESLFIFLCLRLVGYKIRLQQKYCFEMLINFQM